MECKNISSKIIILSIIVTVLCVVQPTIGFDIPVKNRLKVKVNKCCLSKEHVGKGKTCSSSGKMPSLLDIPVYNNEKLKKSGNSVKDVFELVPNRVFLIDRKKDFQGNALRLTLYGYKGYLRVVSSF